MQMAVAGSTPSRVRVEGKFFRLGEEKFCVKGVSYGPFALNAAGQPFASPEQTAADFAQVRDLGANVVRIYHVPGRWFLDLAAESGLKVLVDIPWNKHLSFLDTAPAREQAREAVRRAVRACARHPAVFAFSLVNEIPADIVRWSGGKAVEDFIDELVLEARRIDPDCLCTFGNYPPTEFLRPQSVDFVCFNVYLHQQPAFRNYLARLQMLAESKPLLLGELGIDSLREGEARQAEMLGWQLEDAYRGGAAGAVVFSFTDDWHRNGQPIRDWAMGLTRVDRSPKPAFAVVQRQFGAAPCFPLPRHPRVSVVVASYNGERTLKACLESLQRLNYPDYELILVDDGSTDATRQLAAAYPSVRYLRHERNRGLSAARNTGIAAATGEIVAFTDADCRADRDWLHYLVGDLLRSDFAAIGGPNLLPPEDSAVAAAVMASPGGPAHVMLNDREAEHIPGCNMAFYRWALEQVDGFDPVFRAAGDDVDICWRLQQAGHKIGFSPGGFVWHYRRSTLGAYLKQQRGYGEAESLLMRKHPEYFNLLGGSMWRGRIYASAASGLRLRAPVIYRGLFGSAGFQSVYVAPPSPTLMLCTTLEYHVLVTLPLWVLSAAFHFVLPLALTSLLLSVGLCGVAGAQASLPPAKTHWWSRPLIACLFFLQPIVRGWARYRGRLLLQTPARAGRRSLDSIALRDSGQRLEEVHYWAERRVDRLAWVADMLQRLAAQGWPHKPDIGWSDYDVEIFGSRWCSVQLATVVEEHGQGRQTIRCRLRPRWSLQAKVTFWLLCGFELVVLGVWGAAAPWLWTLPVLVPLLLWLLRRDQRDFQSILRVFLDQVAADWHLIPTTPAPARPGEAAPPQAGTSPAPAPSPEAQIELRTTKLS